MNTHNDKENCVSWLSKCYKLTTNEYEDEIWTFSNVESVKWFEDSYNLSRMFWHDYMMNICARDVLEVRKMMNL